MCLPNFMKFRHCLSKLLKNQNIADGQTDRWTMRKQYTSHKHSLRGGGEGGVGDIIRTYTCQTIVRKMHGNQDLKVIRSGKSMCAYVTQYFGNVCKMQRIKLV